MSGPSTYCTARPASLFVGIILESQVLKIQKSEGTMSPITAMPSKELVLTVRKSHGTTNHQPGEVKT